MIIKRSYASYFITLNILCMITLIILVFLKLWISIFLMLLWIVICPSSSIFNWIKLKIFFIIFFFERRSLLEKINIECNEFEIQLRIIEVKLYFTQLFHKPILLISLTWRRTHDFGIIINIILIWCYKCWSFTN